MADWLIRKDPKVEQYWRRLANRSLPEQEAFAEAERRLSNNPYPLYSLPGIIKHLKGSFHCNHEYRHLPNSQRIFYKIWSRQDIENARKRMPTAIPVEPKWEHANQKGIVIFFYAGPHPKTK